MTAFHPNYQMTDPPRTFRKQAAWQVCKAGTIATSGDLEEALRDLVRSGHIRRLPQTRAEAYEVNPLALKAGAHG